MSRVLAYSADLTLARCSIVLLTSYQMTSTIQPKRNTINCGDRLRKIDLRVQFDEGAPGAGERERGVNMGLQFFDQETKRESE